MSNRRSCPVCDHLYEPEGPCENEDCNASVALIKLMDDIESDYLEELEAAGVNVFTQAGMVEPPIIPFLRRLWLEKEIYKKKNYQLQTSLRNVDSALRGAKGFI